MPKGPFDDVIEDMKNLLQEDTVFNVAAQLMMKSVTAMIGAGFTREEAIKILVAHGPLVRGSG